MKNPESRPVLQWSAAMALSGTIGAVVLESGAGAPAVAFARCLVGGLLLVGWSLARGWFRDWRPTRRDLLFAVAGGLLLVGNWVLLFASYSLSSIGVSTVVYHTQPLILVGMAAVFLGEKVSRSHLARAGVAFAGVVVISLSAQGDDGQPVRLAGIALALGAALLYAGASFIAKQLKHIRPHLLAAVQLTVGAIVLAPALMFTPLPSSAPGLWWLLLLGTVHTAVMYVLMYASIGKLPTTTVALLSYLYPVVAVVVDMLAFGHRLTWAEGLGMLAVLAAALAPQRTKAEMRNAQPGIPSRASR
ncbi:DMT family transporter [Amycolatopsis orientalis]|uniref:DMT family transporter n=1 Tax=Amycolatopsis orientalis TaxID=31958 RepID=UPI0003A10908|nr:DMT family transporter [Amycolatopsis orientalis]